MHTVKHSIEQVAENLPPITLEEMSSIRLMNRTDQKYLTDLATLYRLLELARGSYFIQDINGLRICPYATTYWDDEQHSMFRCHQAGHRPRTKVRVRTYVNSGLSFLEVKQKDNHGKTAKTRISIPSINDVITGKIGHEFVHNTSGLSLQLLKPTVGNRFNRITLVNYAKTERLTIDFDLHFYNTETQAEQTMPNIAVIELKRDGRVPSPILPILRELRIKPAGFSKYCIGAALTIDSLPVNRFKKRLIKIRKIADRQQPENTSNLDTYTKP